MCAAEVASKYKNYSRTESLTRRIMMAIVHNNMASLEFHAHVLNDRVIKMNAGLKIWFDWKDGNNAKRRSKTRAAKKK